MKKQEKRMILIIVLVGVIVIGGILLFKNSNKPKENGTQEEPKKEEFVKVLDDGTRLNTSDKLSKTKTFDGLEISNFQLTEKNNVTVLLGTITNKTNGEKGDYPINIKILDKQGNEIVTVGGYIGKLQPGESTQLNSSASFDYANAYDFEISKK